MCPRPQYLRLRRLIDESLHRFSDPVSNTLTEEIEKDLLIALSQVFRQVKQLINEFDSDEELLGDPVSGRECLIDATANLDNRRFLAEITGNLIFLLAVNSQYAQHLVGNILVAISEFLLSSDGDWDAFMQLLCLCWELAICNILKSSSVSVLRSQYLDFDPPTRSSLKLKLKNANWSVVAAISRVLHNIQKYLKQDFDEDCLQAYLDCVSSLLVKFPWDLLRESYVSHNDEALKGSAEDALLKIEDVQPREITMVFGSFIQLLCSLVTLSGSLAVGHGFSLVISRITKLVPKLTSWCHVDLQSTHLRISHYFRHKVLMLMIKLSSSMCNGRTVSMAWMHLLHKYFEDILLQPISGGKLDQDDSLEGSPFCTSVFDPEKHNIPSFHLQRLAILLFLKCSLNCDNTGFTELHKWLQFHVPPHKDELYFEQCMKFKLSFLQLFMHEAHALERWRMDLSKVHALEERWQYDEEETEGDHGKACSSSLVGDVNLSQNIYYLSEDDILFEMLLQLFNVPSFQGHQIIEDETPAEVKNCLIADLFNPIHLFHLFLAEIKYDHQVLLDYLISKDTGSSCAEYLLRSLRIICDSWSLFVEFPGVGDDSGQLCVKRRKISASLEESGTSTEEGHAHGNKLPIVAAGDCLASLTTSIDNLYRKRLFPYNPQVLLRRLMKFQELSVGQ